MTPARPLAAPVTAPTEFFGGTRSLAAPLAVCRERAEAQDFVGGKGYRLSPKWVANLKQYGIVPPDFDPAKTPFDPYELDQKYYASHWRPPSP